MRYIRAVTAVFVAALLVSLLLIAHPAKAASQTRFTVVTVHQDHGIVAQAEARSETATTTAPGVTARFCLKILSSNHRRPTPETVHRE